MKIHSLSVVKNEADIIAQSLRAAAKWSDHIFVLDNGSADGTWERVLELSREIQQVIPFRRDSRPFDNAIRREIQTHYHSWAQPGDWWCILDADEFFIDDPKRFLSAIPREFKAVWKQEFAYQLTEKDLEAFRQDPSRFDDEAPIDGRLRYYASPDYSEARFVRHSDTLAGWYRLRPVYPRRIRAKHFQYRSPAQIQNRIETRRDAIRRGVFPHETRGYWMTGVLVPGPAAAEEIP